MGLSIVYESQRVQSIDWHINEQTPLSYGDIPFVGYIQASGHELEKVQELFTSISFSQPVYNIPMPRKQVVTWYGDIAKTILAALFY